MGRLGILAYGSLQDWLGKEIEPLIINRIPVTTPFNVEFARSSSRRSGAPTLIPVGVGGKKIKAQILELAEGKTEDYIKDILWRRETYRIGKTEKKYKEVKYPSENDVIIRQIENFQGMDRVFYTEIPANIKPLTPEHLAQLAIKSYNSKTASLGLDGITYLFNAKMRGIQTPLMPAYEKEILEKLGASDLAEAQAVLYLDLLKAEGKIPKETQRLEGPITKKDVGKLVAITAKIGKTYVKLSPPIVLTSEYDGKKYSSSFRTILLGLEAEINNSYVFVGFKKKTERVDVINYFNNLMAIFNIISIPFDFIAPSDILVEAEGSVGKMEFISSSKAHYRGYGITPVEISMLDFSKVVLAIHFLWLKIERSKYFQEDNFYQLLGYAQNYFFHGNCFLAFVHAFIFLESCVNVLWRELMKQSYGDEDKTPLDEERNWTLQVKIEELFLKGIIDGELRKELQDLRNKRNNVFHRDSRPDKRTVKGEDAKRAIVAGLRLFYSMLEPKQEGIVYFRKIGDKMWKAINRDPVYRTKIKKAETTEVSK